MQKYWPSYLAGVFQYLLDLAYRSALTRYNLLLLLC